MLRSFTINIHTIKLSWQSVKVLHNRDDQLMGARVCVVIRYPPAINCAILLCVLINACGIMNPNAPGLLFSDVNSPVLGAPDFITLCGIRTIPTRVSLFRIPRRNLFVAGGRRGKTTRSRFCLSVYGSITISIKEYSDLRIKTEERA